MSMAALLLRYTVDDLDSFPDDGNRYELVDGALLVTPAPMPAHELVLLRIRDQLVGHLGRTALVFTRGAVELRPRNHLEPDLLVFPADQPVARRWSEMHGFWLAVEVSGRHSRRYDRDVKHQAYLRLGVPEVWRVDLLDRCVEVRRTDQLGLTVHRDRLDWRAPGAAAALSLDLAAVFAEIQGDD